MLKIIITWLISRCASGPLNMSRMTTRLTMVPAPAKAPCATRQAMSTPRLGESAQPMVART